MNGFAADGKNFVKKVKQRLEVSFCAAHGSPSALTYNVLWNRIDDVVVHQCASQGDASEVDCPSDSDYVVRGELFFEDRIVASLVC